MDLRVDEDKETSFLVILEGFAGKSAGSDTHCCVLEEIRVQRITGSDPLQLDTSVLDLVSSLTQDLHPTNFSLRHISQTESRLPIPIGIVNSLAETHPLFEVQNFICGELLKEPKYPLVLLPFEVLLNRICAGRLESQSTLTVDIRVTE
jgi:hypothetical protein